MKRITAVLLGSVALAGCSVVAPGVEVTDIYTPGMLGGRIGEIKRIEDKDKGIVIYVRIGAQGSTQMQAFVVGADGKLVAVK